MFKKLTLGVLILIESTPRTSLGVVNTTHTDIVKPWAPNEAKSSKSKQALAQQSSCELLRWRNMELYGTACKEVELQASSLNFMKVYVSVCKLMELHASSWNCMQAHKTACKVMALLGKLANLGYPLVTLSHVLGFIWGMSHIHGRIDDILTPWGWWPIRFYCQPQSPGLGTRAWQQGFRWTDFHRYR